MAKKKTLSTKPSTTEESKQETSASSKSIKGDLDSLFKNKKSKAIKKPEKDVKKDAKPVKFEKPTVTKKEGPRKYTEEGFKIYSAAELKMGQGGNTEDCPFDCDCCF